MMVTCRSSAERHRGLSQGYIRERRLDNWFRGWPSRSALLKSQESAGRIKALASMSRELCMLYSPRLSPRRRRRRETLTTGAANGQSTNTIGPSKVGAPKSGARLRGRPLTRGPRRAFLLAHQSGMSWEGIDDQDVTLPAFHHHTTKMTVAQGPSPGEPRQLAPAPRFLPRFLPRTQPHVSARLCGLNLIHLRCKAHHAQGFSFFHHITISW